MYDKQPGQLGVPAVPMSVPDLRARHFQTLQQEAAIKAKIENLCLSIFSKAASDWVVEIPNVSLPVETIIERSMEAAFKMASALWGVEIQRTPKIIPITSVEGNTDVPSD